MNLRKTMRGLWIAMMLGVVLGAMTSCERKVLCECGTIVSVSTPNGQGKLIVVSDCEEDYRCHTGEIESPEWTDVIFMTIAEANSYEEGETYCGIQL